MGHVILTARALMMSNVPKRNATPININKNPAILWHMHLQEQQESVVQHFPSSIEKSSIYFKKQGQ